MDEFVRRSMSDGEDSVDSFDISTCSGRPYLDRLTRSERIGVQCVAQEHFDRTCGR